MLCRGFNTRQVEGRFPAGPRFQVTPLSAPPRPPPPCTTLSAPPRPHWHSRPHSASTCGSTAAATQHDSEAPHSSQTEGRLVTNQSAVMNDHQVCWWGHSRPQQVVSNARQPGHVDMNDAANMFVVLAYWLAALSFLPELPPVDWPVVRHLVCSSHTKGAAQQQGAAATQRQRRMHQHKLAPTGTA